MLKCFTLAVLKGSQIPCPVKGLVLLEAGSEKRQCRATFLPSLLQEVDTRLFWLQKKPHPLGVKEL